jgi:spore maturation protein CgeB
MREHLRAVLHEPQLAAQLALQGRRTILARHTCAHRVDELMDIYAELAPPPRQLPEEVRT